MKRFEFPEDIYLSLLKPAERISMHMNRTVKRIGVLLSFLVFSVYFLLHNSGFFVHGRYVSYFKLHVFGFLVLIVLILFSIERPLHRIKWDKPGIYMLLLCGAGLVITGLIHPIGDGYLFFGIMILSVYPCLYYVWANRNDCSQLFDAAALAQVIAGLGYFVIYALLAMTGQIDTTVPRQAGTMLNANYFSTYGACMMLSSLYLLYRKRRTALRQNSLLISALIIGFFVVLMGQSRVSFVVCSGSVLCTLIFTVKNHYMNSKLRPRLQLRGMIIGLAIITVACVVLVHILGQGDQSFLSRFSTEGKTADDYFAGRLTIWNNYASHLNLLGNDFSQVDWVELTGDTVRHAHNNFLEIAYRSGIPVGLFFIAFQLYAGIRTIVFLFSGKYTEDYYLFAVLFMINYTMESLFDVATMSMERYSSFFFYILLCAVFRRRRRMATDGREIGMP